MMRLWQILAANHRRAEEARQARIVEQKRLKASELDISPELVETPEQIEIERLRERVEQLERQVQAILTEQKIAPYRRPILR
jgi:polyhydroxyalkanoate synthesis regulator phasin